MSIACGALRAQGAPAHGSMLSVVIGHFHCHMLLFEARAGVLQLRPLLLLQALAARSQ